VIYGGGGTPVVPKIMEEKGKEKSKEKGKEKDLEIPDNTTDTSTTSKANEISTRATIIVNLPADAQLTIADQKTLQIGERRTFISPELPPGKEYIYTFKAEVVRGGTPITWTERVTVQAGKETQLTLTVPGTGVASR